MCLAWLPTIDKFVSVRPTCGSLTDEDVYHLKCRVLITISKVMIINYGILIGV